MEQYKGGRKGRRKKVKKKKKIEVNVMKVEEGAREEEKE